MSILHCILRFHTLHFKNFGIKSKKLIIISELNPKILKTFLEL